MVREGQRNGVDETGTREKEDGEDVDETSVIRCCCGGGGGVGGGKPCHSFIYSRTHARTGMGHVMRRSDRFRTTPPPPAA